MVCVVRLTSPVQGPARLPGLVLRGGVSVLLVHRTRYGHDEWVVPKGHIEPGETPEQAALREVAEETGLEKAVAHRRIGVYRYTFSLPDDPREHHKSVTVFLMTSPDGEAPLAASGREGIDEVRWVEAGDAERLASHKNERALVRKAVRAAARLARAAAIDDADDPSW